MLHHVLRDAIAILDVRPLDAAFVDGELMAEGDVLEGELRALLDCEVAARTQRFRDPPP
jgi:hypothetical protein